MRTKRLQNDLNQLVLDFFSVVETALTPNAVLHPTFEGILTEYPKDRPLDWEAAKVLTDHSWSEFITALGENPSKAAVDNAGNRFLQAAELLTGRTPSDNPVGLYSEFSAQTLEAKDTPGKFAADWIIARDAKEVDTAWPEDVLADQEEAHNEPPTAAPWAAKPTLAEVLKDYPKDRPLDRAAAEAVGPHSWSEFVSALGRKPGKEALENAETRFLQAVEVLSGWEPSLKHRVSGNLESDATPAEWAEGWKKLDAARAEAEASLGEPKAATPADPEQEAFAEFSDGADPAADAALEKFLTDPKVIEAHQVFENIMLDSGASDPGPEEDEPELEEPDPDATAFRRSIDISTATHAECVAFDEAVAADEERRPRSVVAAADADLAAIYAQYAKQFPVIPEANKPVTELTEEDLMERDANGEPAVQALILNGTTDELAPGVVTEEVCLAADPHGNNAAHVIARYCEEIPDAFQAVLTERVLSAPDINGRTPAHEFARAGMINHLPEEALTEAVLNRRDDYGMTALQYAEEAGEPCQVAFEAEPAPEILVRPPQPVPTHSTGRGIGL